MQTCLRPDCRLCLSWKKTKEVLSENNNKTPLTRKAEPLHQSLVKFESLDKYGLTSQLLFLQLDHLQSFCRIFKIPHSFPKVRLAADISELYFKDPKLGFVHSLLTAFVDNRTAFLRILELEINAYRAKRPFTIGSQAFSILNASNLIAPAAAAPRPQPPPPQPPPPPPAAAPRPQPPPPQVSNVRVVLKGTTISTGNEKSPFDIMAHCRAKPKLGWKPDDLVTTSTVSLVDPISLLRIQTPVKTDGCKHANSFDLKTHCSMFAGKAIWKCPICDCDAKPNLLKIDGWLEGVLKETSMETKVVKVNQSGLLIPSPVSSKRKFGDLDLAEGSSTTPIVVE